MATVPVPLKLTHALALQRALDHGAEFESGRYPHTADSVLNFGLPTLSGQFASTVQASAVENGIKRALTMLEPLLILVLGVLIAAIIVSILLGILSVNDLAV